MNLGSAAAKLCLAGVKNRGRLSYTLNSYSIVEIEVFFCYRYLLLLESSSKKNAVHTRTVPLETCWTVVFSNITVCSPATNCAPPWLPQRVFENLPKYILTVQSPQGKEGTVRYLRVISTFWRLAGTRCKKWHFSSLAARVFSSSSSQKYHLLYLSMRNRTYVWSQL